MIKLNRQKKTKLISKTLQKFISTWVVFVPSFEENIGISILVVFFLYNQFFQDPNKTSTP